MKLNRQYNMDCRDGLEQMITDKQQVDCVITSPPYYLVRDYKIPPSIWGGNQNCNHDFSIETINIKSTKNKDFNKRYGGSSGQKKQEKSQQLSIKRGFCSKCNAWLGDLGNEPNINLYISHLCDIFDLIKQVLKDSGSCWVNIADTYSTQGGQNRATDKDYSDYSSIKMENRMIGVPLIKPKDLPPKCLMEIPFRFAIEMVNRGWIHRQTVIWEKGNPFPSSVMDNFSPCYEYLFWFVKNSKKLYWTNKKTLQSVSKKPLGTKGIENIDWEWKICTKCEGKGFIEESGCPSCKGLGKRKRTLWKSHDYYFEQQREGLSDNPATQERYKYKVGNQSNRKDDGVKLVKPGKAFSKYFPKNLDHKTRGYKTKQNLEPNPQHHGVDIKPILSGRNMRNVWHINVGKSSEPHFACIDNKSLILTKDGWKSYKDIKKTDNIATFDILTEKIRYYRPFSIYFYNYKGVMIRIKNQWIDKLITPNHRVLLKYGHKENGKKWIEKNWRYINAKNLRGYEGIIIPNAGKYDGTISIGKYRAELLGWIITDASIRKGSITIYQSITKNPHKVKRIEWLLNKTNQFYKKHERCRSYNGRPYYMVNFRLNKTENDNSWIFNWINENRTPRWKLLHLKQKELRHLFNGIIDGDGSRRKDGRISFGQKNLETHDWFRVLCIHLGYRTTLGKGTRNYKNSKTYITRRNNSQIHPSRFKDTITEVYYEGIVWCPQLPNSNFIMKRNGKICITGNTFPQALVERPIKATTPKFICPECGLPKVKIISAEGGTIGTSWHNHKNDSSMGMSQKHSFNMEGYTREFVGYSNCDCNTTKFIPGIVLDPFAGLGNALKKAWHLGRDFIGFEISKRYCQIFEKWNRNRSIRLDNFISGGIK